MNWDHKKLLTMQDYELIMEARDAVINEIRNAASEEDLEKIPEIRFYLIAAGIFDMEMQNGGLGQFLVNQGKIHGRLLEDALSVFGAEEHRRIIAAFCGENGIDLKNLQEIIPETKDPYSVMENYMRLIRKYPFADFDRSYFELDAKCPLEGILGAYIRNHLTVFFGN